MALDLKNFSIVDIVHHEEIDSATGKIKFQFEDISGEDALDQFVIVDVSVPATSSLTLGALQDNLLAKAASVLATALYVADIGHKQIAVPAPAIKAH